MRVGLWLALATLLPAACGPRSEPAAFAGPSGTCAIGAPRREPLELNSVPAYVEAQNLIPVDAGLLLAGAPTFEWPLSDGRTGEPVAHRILGVVIRPDTVEEIGRPPDIGHLGVAHAIRLGGDRWGWLLMRTTTPSIRTWDVVDIVYAEQIQGRWSPPRSIPFPEGFEPNVLGSSKPGEGDPAWVVQGAEPYGRHGTYAYRREAWTHYSVDERPVERSQLALDSSLGTWALTSGPDYRHHPEGSVRSVRVFRPDSSQAERGASETEVWVGELGDEIHFARLEALGGSLALGWLVLGDADVPTAWAATVTPGATEPAAVRLTSGARWIVPVRLPGGVPAWAVHHSPEDRGPHGELRLYQLGPDGRPRLSRSIPHPFSGYFDAVVMPSGELVIAGPEVVEDPVTPFVRSLLLRLSVSCD